MPNPIILRRSTPKQGAPYRIVVAGVTYERVTLAGQFVSIGGLPAYMQVS